MKFTELSEAEKVVIEGDKLDKFFIAYIFPEPL